MCYLSQAAFGNAKSFALRWQHLPLDRLTVSASLISKPITSFSLSGKSLVWKEKSSRLDPFASGRIPSHPLLSPQLPIKSLGTHLFVIKYWMMTYLASGRSTD